MNQMKMGDKIMIGLILVIAAGIFIYFNLTRPEGNGTKAIIEVDGVVVKTFDLPQSEVIEYKVQIDADDYNLIRIEGSQVRVIEATCPEQVDVLAGWIMRPGEMLVCLPHKLIVRIEGEQSFDDEIDVKTF